MLVSFTLDPEIFANAYTVEERYRHDKLIELWEMFGCMVLAGQNEEGSRLKQAMEKAPPPIRKRWQVAWKQLRRSCCVSDFDPQSTEMCSEWLEELTNRVQIVSLEATRALCWGLPEDEYSLACEQAAEICRFGFESESIGFKHVRTLSQTPIEKGSTWRQVWSQRIEPIALESKNITVADRYALVNLLERDEPGLSGLERLVQQLSGLKKGKQRNLCLFAGMPIKWEHKDLLKKSLEKIRDCQSILKGSSLREVRVHVRLDSAFRDDIHYRYIRFDDHQLLQLDTGLEPLGGDMVKRLCSTHILPWKQDVCKAYRDVEKGLKAAKGPDECISF